jgi:hypothetical protein
VGEGFLLFEDILTSQVVFCCAVLFGWLIGGLGRFFTFLYGDFEREVHFNLKGKTVSSI